MRDALRISGLAYMTLAVSSTIVAAVLLLPTFIVVPMSFSDGVLLEFPPKHWSLRWWQQLYHAPDWMGAIKLSVILALSTSLVAVPLAAMAAQVGADAGERARAIVHRILVAPLVVPSILVGTGLFFLYARLFINGTFGGLLVGHVLMATPAAYMVLRPAFAGFDSGQYHAARSLGASAFQAWRLVVVPQLRLSFLAATLLAFLTSLDEVIISVLVGGGHNTTITKIMFESLRDRIDPMTAVVSTAWTLLVVSVLAVVRLSALDPQEPVAGVKPQWSGGQGRVRAHRSALNSGIREK